MHVWRAAAACQHPYRRPARSHRCAWSPTAAAGLALGQLIITLVHRLPPGMGSCVSWLRVSTLSVSRRRSRTVYLLSDQSIWRVLVFLVKKTHTHTKINLKSEAVLWTWRRALLTAAAIYLFPELLSSAGRSGIRGQAEKVPSAFWFDRKLQLPYCTCRANLVTLHWAICWSWSLQLSFF